MPSSKNLIQSLRSAHDPHFKLEGRVGGLEKGLGIQVAQLHKTLSKSFAMQRKTLVRVLGLEGRVGVLESQQAAEEQAQEGIDEILDEILGDSGDKPKKKKPAAKKKRPAKPIGKRIPKKKPVAKKKKISAKDLKKGTSLEPSQWFLDETARREKKKADAERHARNAQESAEGDERRKTSVYQEDVYGDTSSGDHLSGAERKRRFKLRKKGIKVEDIKRGTSVQGAENVAPNNEVTDLAKRQAAGDLPQGVTEPPAQGEGQQSQLEGIKSPLKSIAESIDRIKDSLTGQSKVQEDALEDARKSDEEKEAKKREGGLEKFLGPVKAVGDKILKPFKSMFSQVLDFLTTIFFGRIAYKLFDWMSNPANTDKITSIFKFIADWWPVLLAGIMAFLPGLLGPVGMIAGVVALLIWGVPKIINAVKSIFGFGKDIDKELKTGGDDLDKQISKAGKDAEKKLEPGSEDESPAQVAGDPSKSGTPQELSGAEDSQQKVQKLNKGGEVKGSGDKDTVPAMLTPGEFVMSKGAVEQYGADTLAGMNAAAGGTNIPGVQKSGDGGGKGTNVPRFSGGGSASSTGSSDGFGRGQGPVQKYNQGGVVSDNSVSYYNGGGVVSNNSIFNSKGGGFIQKFNQGGLVQKYNEGGLVQKYNGGGLVQHFNGGGLIQKFNQGGIVNKLPQVKAAKWLGNKAKGAFNAAKDKVAQISGSQKSAEHFHIDPPQKSTSTQASSAQVAQSSGDAATVSDTPAPGIPNFDAGMMRSQSKIRTLGVSV